VLVHVKLKPWQRQSAVVRLQCTDCSLWHALASSGLVASAHLDVFHHDVDVRRCLDDLVKADDVRVHEQPQNLDLSPHYMEQLRQVVMS
jgi:hypothetical protein